MTRATNPARRVVSIWWPRLSIERWAKLTGGDPREDRVVLVVEAQHGQLILAATEAAMAGGARIGGRLTDARALDPELVAVNADVAGDRALAARLARWATRWSPLVEIDGDDGLRLDATGAAHLFGGEAAMLAEIEARFTATGLTARAAAAPTAGAAWALARYGGQRGDDLSTLPVAALRLPPQVSRTLERLGLKTIGALAGIERRSLARRFREADNPLDALDRMLGRKPEPLTAAPFDPPPRSLMRLAEPVTDPAVGVQALDRLVPDLVRQLEARRLGVRRLALSGYRVDGETITVATACALPTREAPHLVRLLKDKAETLDPGFGFDGFALEASWCEPLGAMQDGLDGGTPPALAVARLVDRLTVKLGPERVRRPAPRESHIPERASGWQSAVADAPPTPDHCHGQARPERLLDAPEAIGVIYATPEGLPRRFMWRRRVHDIVRAEGPERISPEWWRERATARLRDYYRVEDREGRRYWIYREGLHGDGRGGDPGWYLHGLFG